MSVAKDTVVLCRNSSRKVLQLLEGLARSHGGSLLYRQVERILRDVENAHLEVERVYAGIVGMLLDAYARHLDPDSPLANQVRLLQACLQPPLSPSEIDALREFIEVHTQRIAQLGAPDPAVLQQTLQPLLEGLGLSAGVEPPVPVEPVPAPEAAEPSRAEPPPEPPAPPPPRAEPPPETPPAPQPPAAPPPPAAPAVGAAPVQPAAVTPGAEPPAPQAQPYSGPAPQPQPAEPHAEAAPPPPAAPVSDETAAAQARDTTPVEADAAGTEQHVNTAYRRYLNERRKDMQRMQTTLAQQVMETIAQNQEFGVLLEVVLDELRHNAEGQDIERLRQTLIQEVEKLTDGHRMLAEKLDSTYHYLEVIESDSQQLSDELTRVRLLSLTDELTGLPNRRAFLRRLEEEVGRVQRYGFPLSLALIDLDWFKNINDKYGHAAGDEVLRCYASNILSLFRHHDMVARYGGEEFAVLLPNTNREGALRALNKVKKRAGETCYHHGGAVRQLPTFSAGLAVYQPGETPSALIERADNALYRAKRLGRDRIEVDETYVDRYYPSSSEQEGGENA